MMWEAERGVGIQGRVYTKWIVTEKAEQLEELIVCLPS